MNSDASWIEQLKFKLVKKSQYYITLEIELVRIKGVLADESRKREEVLQRANELTSELDQLRAEINAATDLGHQRDKRPAQVGSLSEECSRLTAESTSLLAEQGTSLERVGALTCSVNRLTGQVNELTGLTNDLTRERNELVGKFNEVTGQKNELVGDNNRLHAELNVLTGEVNRLTGEVNVLTGERNAFVGQVGKLTRRVNELTGTLNHLTGERNRLVGQLATQAASHEASASALRERNDMLLEKVNALSDRRAEGEQEPAGVSAIAAESRIGRSGSIGTVLGPRITRSKKFLIVSNLRSGSTWLEATLGTLPGVATDFELKWGAWYEPGPAHIFIDQVTFTVSELLERLKRPDSIVGSKFVLDSAPFTRVDLADFQDKLGRDVNILHLTRAPEEIFISRRRGLYHQIDEAHVSDLGAHLAQALRQADIKKAAAVSLCTVSRVDCMRELMTYLQNDIVLKCLSSYAEKYLMVDYSEVKRRFAEIAVFLGIEADQQSLEAVISSPPTVKLPALRSQDVVENAEELSPIFKHVNELRTLVLGFGPD